MALPPLLSKIVGWLRAGYPEGVPEHDYIPLFALLGSQLTEAEVSAIADELATSADPGSAEAIKAAIADVTQTPPKDSDIARVRAHLAEGGWPLATPERLPGEFAAVSGEGARRAAVRQRNRPHHAGGALGVGSPAALGAVA